MTKNPLINAIVAFTYIIIVVTIMHVGTQNLPKGDSNLLAPLAGISLFTLSAAVMGYVFCYQPALLLLERKSKEAVDLFLKTTMIFAAITTFILLIYFSGVLSNINKIF